MNLRNEASVYLRRRHAAVHSLLESHGLDKTGLCFKLASAGRLPDRTGLVVAFENTDADELVADFIELLPQEGLSLCCYWLDKKLVSLPRVVHVATCIEEYAEIRGEEAASLVIVRQTLDPEPVSAIIHRAVRRIAPTEVSVLSLLSTDAAEERLLGMLPMVVASKTRFFRIATADYGDDLFLPEGYKSGEGSGAEEEGTYLSAIQQVDRKLFMPRLITERRNPRPAPEGGAAPPSLTL